MSGGESEGTKLRASYKELVEATWEEGAQDQSKVERTYTLKNSRMRIKSTRKREKTTKKRFIQWNRPTLS